MDFHGKTSTTTLKNVNFGTTRNMI